MSQIKPAVVSQLIQDYRRLPLIRKELEEMLERETKRHMMDSDHYYQTALENAIDALNEYLEYDPSCESGGEPPMTMDEIHTAAWKEHLEAHS
jgi:hypothetical protein